MLPGEGDQGIEGTEPADLGLDERLGIVQQHGGGEGAAAGLP